MLPKSGSLSADASGIDGLKLAIAQAKRAREDEENKKTHICSLHYLYYTYKRIYHSEPLNVFEMIKGMVIAHRSK